MDLSDYESPIIEKSPEQAAALVQPPAKEGSTSRDGAEMEGNARDDSGKECKSAGVVARCGGGDATRYSWILSL